MTSAAPPTSSDARVYRVSRGWRVFLGVGGGGMAAFLLASPWFVFAEAKDPTGALIISAMLVGFGVFFAAVVILSFRARIELFADRIRVVGLVGTKELALDNIAGFRVVAAQGASNLLLFSHRPPPRKLSISLTMERKPEFLAWVHATLPNLDDVDRAVELEKARADSTLGATEQERLASLDRARKTVRVLSAAGTVVGLWAIVFPRPYLWAVGVAAVVPLAALLVLRLLGPSAQLDGKPTDARPSVGLCLVVPPLALALRAFLDWHVLAWTPFWVPFFWISGGLVLALVLASRKSRARPLSLAAFCALLMVHAYGAAVSANSIFDRSKATLHETMVTDARVSRGKVTTYTLTVTPWIDGTGARDVDVPRQVYEARPVGSRARIGVRAGALGIPWYFVF